MFLDVFAHPVFKDYISIAIRMRQCFHDFSSKQEGLGKFSVLQHRVCTIDRKSVSFHFAWETQRTARKKMMGCCIEWLDVLGTFCCIAAGDHTRTETHGVSECDHQNENQNRSPGLITDALVVCFRDRRQAVLLSEKIFRVYSRGWGANGNVAHILSSILVLTVSFCDGLYPGLTPPVTTFVAAYIE